MATERQGLCLARVLQTPDPMPDTMSSVMPSRRADPVGLACGIPAALLGMLAILGWILQLPSLVEVLPSAAPMKLNTAIGLVLGGLGLPGFARRSRLRLVTGGLLFALGVLTVVEYVAAVDLGIDQFLLADGSGGDTPGRMGLNTAVCFSGLGLAYIVASVAPWMVGIVALPAAVGLLSVSMAAIVGYLTGMEFVYRWAGPTRMGVHTAAAIFLLGAGLLVAGWRRVERRRATWLAMGLSGCVAGITVVVWLGGRAEQALTRAQDAQRRAGDITRLIVHGVDDLVGALHRLDERWADPMWRCLSARCHGARARLPGAAPARLGQRRRRPLRGTPAGRGRHPATRRPERRRDLRPRPGRPPGAALAERTRHGRARSR